MIVNHGTILVVKMCSTPILLLWSLLPVVMSYSGGAPASVYICRSMKPGHGHDVQTGPSPYKITVSQPCYKAGDTITVKIETTGPSIKGFFVQARSGFDDSTSYGTFSTSGSGMKLKSCWGVVHNAITHSSSAQKNIVSFYWQPKAGNKAPIKFTATVVQKYNTYWVGLISDPVLYNANCLKTPTATTTTPTTIPTTTPTTTTTITPNSTTTYSTTTNTPTTTTTVAFTATTYTATTVTMPTTSPSTTKTTKSTPTKLVSSASTKKVTPVQSGELDRKQCQCSRSVAGKSSHGESLSLVLIIYVGCVFIYSM